MKVHGEVLPLYLNRNSDTQLVANKNLIAISYHDPKGMSGLSSEAQEMDEVALHEIVRASTVN